MGHRRLKEASEDYHLLYSNTQEEFRWARELARLELSQENSPCLAISTVDYLMTLSQMQRISSQLTEIAPESQTGLHSRKMPFQVS